MSRVRDRGRQRTIGETKIGDRDSQSYRQLQRKRQTLKNTDKDTEGDKNKNRQSDKIDRQTENQKVTETHWEWWWTDCHPSNKKRPKCTAAKFFVLFQYRCSVQHDI